MVGTGRNFSRLPLDKPAESEQVHWPFQERPRPNPLKVQTEAAKNQLKMEDFLFGECAVKVAIGMLDPKSLSFDDFDGPGRLFPFAR